MGAAILVAGGCGAKLMGTPAVIADGQINPFEQVEPDRRTGEAPVLIASGRTVSGSQVPPLYYTDDRSIDVRVGLATVEIGPGMDWDELVAESTAKRRAKEVDIDFKAYEEFGPLWSTAWPPNFRFDPDWDAPGLDRAPAERFTEVLESMLAQSKRKQVTIFVHGFNTKFGANVELAAEFWHYMARDDVIMSFDWPSRGSMFSYQKDKANAEFAVRQLRVLLEFLATRTSVHRINIIGHSAGCPVVVEALRQLSLIHYREPNADVRRATKIGRVALAAPDMDLDEALSAGVDGAGRVTEGLAVYASRRDRALGFSADIFGDVRVGRSIGKLSEEERAALIANDGQWIDVTRAQRRHSSFIGHSYFHQNPWVSSDLMLFLALGATAEERGLVRNEETAFLEFPEDYEDRLPEIVERLRAKYAPNTEPPDVPEAPE